jgi:hypothetical protein
LITRRWDGKPTPHGKFFVKNYRKQLTRPIFQVEDCSDGIAFMQLLDAMYPSQVLLHKLDFRAKNSAERSKNIRELY